MFKHDNRESKNEIESKTFELETTSMWSFPQRGNWSVHNGRFRGNWSPYIPRNIILRYSDREDAVLDQFVGSGTTMIESMLLGRRGFGVDINSNSLNIAKENIEKVKCEYNIRPKLRKGDARKLDFVGCNSVDLICTHPPYSNIIKYSDKIEMDLSRMNPEEFLIHMELVAQESFRILKNKRYCVIMMGDIRKNKSIIPLGFKVMSQFIETGFVLKEIIIKEQHNCRMTKYWKEKSIEHNFLLIAHEYLFVFYKN